MKTGDLTKLFGVSDTTIRNWVIEFEDFLSPNAKRETSKQRNFTEDDLLVLATIAKLSVDGLPYQVIQERLNRGERVEHPGVSNFGIDTRMVPAAAVEQMLDSTQMRVELEQLRSERDKLLELLEQAQEQLEQARQREEIVRREKDAQLAQSATEAREREQSLQNEIRELLRLLGRAEGKLEEIERNRNQSNE